MKLAIYFSITNQLLISQHDCLSYNRVYDLSDKPDLESHVVIKLELGDCHIMYQEQWNDKSENFIYIINHTE